MSISKSSPEKHEKLRFSVVILTLLTVGTVLG